ncbi:MAG: hypothetical protein K2M12_01850 [Muribaculaceae bacterium]|nr:hypothetical protein [Muribaculaceae bacterium]
MDSAETHKMDKKVRHDRILDCRYYNGEENPPADTNAMFWHYECGWANGKYEDMETERHDMAALSLELWLYTEDGTDPDLKCLLFNRYCHWVGLHGDPKGFVRWYEESYVRPRKTNRQRRADERRPGLIEKCRYYKGEQDNPYKNTRDEMNWFYESCWVKQLSESYQNADIYKREAGGKFDDISRKYDVPRSLIGLFLNRYEHWACWGEVDIEYFRNWLLHQYLKIKD